MSDTKELTFIEACASCLEDDAAQMLADNPGDECAKNMQDAARLLEQMYEALEMLAAHFVWPGESANDRFERIARAFYKDTGMLAPGKDVSAAANESEERRTERVVAFGRWNDARVLPALSALKAARGEQ